MDGISVIVAIWESAPNIIPSHKHSKADILSLLDVGFVYLATKPANIIQTSRLKAALPQAATEATAAATKVQIVN